jgi:hypothetical protein
VANREVCATAARTFGGVDDLVRRRTGGRSRRVAAARSSLAEYNRRERERERERESSERNQAREHMLEL